MAMNFKNVKSWLAAMALACIMGSVSHLSALPLTIGDSRDLGLINPKHPANPDDSEDFVNILLGLSPGSGPTTIGANTYTRTLNDPLLGNYPDAVFSAEFGENVTDIPLGDDGYLYLLAKYDGPNFGSVVWYVGGLTGDITIPLFGSGEQFAVSHTYLFNPNGAPPNGVPDSGTTVMLLGTALACIGALRRRFA
jgi:hypothetical protein